LTHILFGTVPLDEAVAMLLTFFCIGLLIAWRNRNTFELKPLIQFVIATTVTRYIGSYWVYGKPLREGVWPILWTAAAILGISLIRRRWKG
jgi:hypothetical protein